MNNSSIDKKQQPTLTTRRLTLATSRATIASTVVTTGNTASAATPLNNEGL